MNTVPSRPSDFRPSRSEATLLLRPEGATLSSNHDKPSRIASSVLALFLTISTAAREALTQEAPTSRSTAAAEQRESEAARIAKIVEAFLALEARALPILELHVESPEMRNKIRRLFEIVRTNRYMSHPAGFRYRLVKGMYHPAAFHGRNRELSLPANFDPEDIGSLTTFAHEVSHAEHDDEHRARVPVDQYNAYWGVPNPDGKTIVVVVSDEADAIDRQLELLNALMYGELKRRARQGLFLEIPTKDDYTAKFLDRFARVYFRNPSTFQAAVEHIYRSFPGAVFFTPDLTRIP